MGKLHELLAVESDRKATAAKILEEAKTTFTKREEHFTELRKEYTPDNENDRQLEQPKEVKPMVETVNDKLRWVGQHVGALIDLTYQKELANTEAKADVVLENGEELATQVPATVLLNLEAKLKEVREVYALIPTLQPGEEWKREENGHYSAVDKKIRTKKIFKNHVKAPATDKHAAQVEVYSEDERIGLSVTTKVTSLLTVADKARLLCRVDELARAVKRARQRANNTEAKNVEIAKKLFAYINASVV